VNFKKAYNKLINWTYYGCHRFCERKTWQKQRQPTRQLLGRYATATMVCNLAGNTL